MRDHQTSEILSNTMENPTNRLARWLDRLRNYTFDITYRQGRVNGNTDALLRMVDSNDVSGNDVEDFVITSWKRCIQIFIGVMLEYSQRLQTILQSVYRQVKDSRDVIMDKAKIRRDRKVRAAEYKVDDLVWLFNDADKW